MTFLFSVIESGPTSWLILLVGVGLIVSDWWPKGIAERTGRPEYMPAFEAFRYIWNESNWGRGPPVKDGIAVSNELQRVLEIGAIKATGIRHGFLEHQELPAAHWMVAALHYVDAITPANPDPNQRMRTIALGSDSNITATYSDVQLRRKDILRQWPKRRWWHKLHSLP